MAPPFGHTNNERYKTPEERMRAYKEFCEHISQGYSEDSFHTSKKIFTRMFTVYPTEFTMDVLEELEAARRENLKFWEKLGIGGSMGKLPGFNALAWKFNISNRHGWRERSDMTSDDKEIKGIIIYKPAKNIPEEVSDGKVLDTESK